MDNKKTIRNLLICLGIPIIFILIIGILFSTQPKKEYPTSDIVYLFKDNKVTEYKLDFGSGKLELTVNEKYEGKTLLLQASPFSSSPLRTMWRTIIPKIPTSL